MPPWAIGKWHVGDHPDFLPTSRGFDHYLGLPYSNDMGRNPGSSRHSGSPPLPLVKDTTVIETLTGEGQDNLTARYTEAAVAFIREKKDQPFFLYFPHTAVHTPLHPGPAFKGKSGNGAYGDWVEEVDWSVGRILETLRELDLAGNTLVIFTSDNGPWLIKGKDGGVSGPLRGGKGGTYEGGVRVPTLAWWPGKIPAGRTVDGITANFDFLPTFASLAGGELPKDHKIDGRDLSGLLLGKSTESPHDSHLYFSGNTLQAIRSGPWKLAITRQSEADGKPDPHAGKPFAPTLYNLETDLGETTDVAAEHPEIVARLKALIPAIEADLGVTAQGPGVRPPGKVAKPTGLWLPGQQPSSQETPAKAPAKTLAELAPGDTLKRDQAPQIANKPFTLKLTIEPSKPEGIILAHGGSAAGYALHLHGGKLVFTLREAKEAFTLSAPAPTGGAYAIEAALAADGSVTLSIDGKPAAAGKAPGLISRQPAEDFALGHDNGKPVADYQGAGPFAGKITHLGVTIH